MNALQRLADGSWANQCEDCHRTFVHRNATIAARFAMVCNCMGAGRRRRCISCWDKHHQQTGCNMPPIKLPRPVDQ